MFDSSSEGRDIFFLFLFPHLPSPGHRHKLPIAKIQPIMNNAKQWRRWEKKAAASNLSANQMRAARAIKRKCDNPIMRLSRGLFELLVSTEICFCVCVHPSKHARNRDYSHQKFVMKSKIELSAAQQPSEAKQRQRESEWARGNKRKKIAEKLFNVL